MGKDRKTDRHSKDKIQKAIRFDREFFDELQAIADANHRPLTWEIELALQAWVEQHKDKIKPT